MLKFGTVLLVVLLAGCSLTRSGADPVQVKLDDIDARLTKIERIMSNESLLQMAQTQDALQADVRTLRGRVDELQNSIEQMRKQQHDLYADLDRRMGSGGAAAAPAAPSTGNPAAASAASPEQQAYVQAFEALKNQNYPGAISGFKQYLTSYPTSDLADNAQYWLGEAYYVNKAFPEALAAFQRVVDKYPQSRKRPDALLKIGYCQYELKQFDQAKVTLTQVTTQFADTPAGHLAQQRLDKMATEQH